MTKVLSKDEAVITSLDHEGRGIAYVDDKILFIDNALVGETVRFKIFKKKKKALFAKSLEIIEPSTERVEPICDYFGMCGGCSMQHFEISSQLAHKQRAFEQTMKHVGKIHPNQLLSPISGPILGYRHKARLRVKFVEKKQKVLIGFNEKLSHFLTDMQSCKVIPKKISDLIRDYNFRYNIKDLDKISKSKLKLSNLRNYYFKNILAFGDLLHRIHPLAGQGFNMTIRDLRVLINIIASKIELGLPMDQSICEEFEKKVKAKNMIFSKGVDLVHEFFKIESKLKSNILSKSIKIISNKPSLNKLFVEIADHGIIY